ncbi:MAG TPA: hypothetical protein VF624_11300 [Tepidisphaeraceae bacterium]
MHPPPSPASVMRRMTLVLLVASLLSIALAVPLFRAGRPLAAGVAWQFLSWGVIDLAIIAIGAPGMTKLASASRDAQAAAVKLRRTLLFNFKLNYFWVGASLAVLVAAWPLRSAGVAGHGLGATLQALLLFVFDRVYVARLDAVTPKRGGE